MFFLFFVFGCVGSFLLCGLSLVVESAGTTLPRGARASHCGGFFCGGAQALGVRASVVVAPVGSVVVAHGLSCSVACGPGLEPVSPALAGGFVTTAPPGKS